MQICFAAVMSLARFAWAAREPIGTFMLADLLKSFRDAAGWMPATEIANTSRIAAKLSSFELDIALIEGPVTNSDLVTFPWMTDEMVVVAPKDHPLTGRPVSYEELERASWLLREEGSSTRDFFETQLHQRLSRVNVSAELNSFDAILRSVRIGLGITYMSKRVLTDPIFGRFLARVEIPDRWMRQLTFCHERGKYLSVDMLEWVEHCRNYARMLERREADALR